MKKIQILELFGGIGAPRAALRNIGVPVKSIDYVEIDEKAVRSYNAMFEQHGHYDPQNVIGYNLKPDILIHGSPCQDFSIAGHQKGGDNGSGTRSSLMWETVHIIEQMGEWMPKVVIWENVKNVLSKYMRKNFERYILYLDKLGYKSTYKVLDARDYGLPQSRERCFTVSTLGDVHFSFDDMEKHQMKDIKSYLQKDVTSGCYMVTQPSVLRVIGKTGIKRATVIKKYAATITTRQDRTPAQVIDLHNGHYRYLTERECWRLMGFNDKDFDAAQQACPVEQGKMNRTLYMQAGNSMPVPVLEEMFKTLLKDNRKEITNE